jgi:hypothetical protein
MTFDPAPTLERFPGSLVRLEEIARSQVGDVDSPA